MRCAETPEVAQVGRGFVAGFPRSLPRRPSRLRASCSVSLVDSTVRVGDLHPGSRGAPSRPIGIEALAGCRGRCCEGAPWGVPGE